ncbi:Uncharacterized conserved protein YlxW, UPF0749 family [Georgenia satyanarayanai]|uniref:Uncharacterized conserved protein YlxW, UPF0749 family n=1 Tax=Georgenia satyanarayanai TaxID=860221 RepID=A0A2Y9C7G4_9MICO|nr:DUF881 domain-containing protein [Georgenia satyanarayanai]PYF97763.1 uncharacterized protein YlxW (UPF0749 family) [Georgenia satyanarayanai]SSA45503.1 Uncharacterized conserved protein YlxW, UPF0749 family [Georgenia satyanarayanai]
MSEPGTPDRRRGSVAVGLVAALAGLLFATSATLLEDDADRSPTNLVDLARVETARLEDNEAEVAALRKQRDALVAAQQPATEPDATGSDLAALAAGRLPVTGPGVVVELWDAPAPPDLTASGLHPDDLVVHQQDLEAVINALWSGGAEAMMIQDQRITATSSVRCVGNVLLLHGRHYSPPYRISAIGDPDALRDAVETSPGVAVYLQYVDSVGLGWSFEESETIDMPAYTGSLRLNHAQAG